LKRNAAVFAIAVVVGFFAMMLPGCAENTRDTMPETPKSGFIVIQQGADTGVTTLYEITDKKTGKRYLALRAGGLVELKE
jgi:hypothetical protein